jgi:hydroxymethylbilane synthase
MGRAKHIIVGSRGDALSMLYRARACAALVEAHPNVMFVDAPEGRGRDGCTKPAALKLEARRAAAVLHRLGKGEIDVAVMDARWIPLQITGALEIAAIFSRTNPFDALVSLESLILDEQPEKTCVAVSDPVKRGQLLYYRSDLRLVDGEDDFGNLFDAMNRGTIEAFVFPASDVEMLNQQEHVAEVFTTSICTPVAGQGALALVGRRDKKDVFSMLRDINDQSAAMEVEIERMFLERVARDGKAPVGVLANVDENEFEIEAAIVALDGSERISGIMSGALADRSRVVEKLANELLASGGEEIVASFRKLRGNG